MTDDEYEALVSRLQKDFLLFRKSRVWHFLGGLLGIGVALGFITWSSTLAALKSERGTAAVTKIEEYAQRAKTAAIGAEEVLSKADEALAEGLSSRLEIAPLLVYVDGCSGEPAIGSTVAQCSATIREPNCNWSESRELAWCKQNSPCKFDTEAVEGVDELRGVCSYEQCKYVCAGQVVGRLLTAR